MGSRDLWIDFRFKFSAVSLTCVEVNNFWTSRFWLQIHLVVQMGVSNPQISGANTFLFPLNWGYALELADAGVFFMETHGVDKDSIGGETGYFIKFLEVFCDWAWTNLDHQSCWNCWVIFQKFVLSFLRNDNLSFGSLYSLEVKPFSALHPHELIVAYGRGNVTWKVNPMKPLFMCDTSSFRTTPFDQEFWIWRSLFQ